MPGSTPRLRHLRSHPHQSRDRNRRGPRGAGFQTPPATAWDLCSTSCPITWASAGAHNPWWWDVLKHGRESRFARYFDIDWDAPDPALRGKVLATRAGRRIRGNPDQGRSPARGSTMAKRSCATSNMSFPSLRTRCRRRIPMPSTPARKLCARFWNASITAWSTGGAATAN